MTTVPGTIPYPWPFDGVLDPARTALVVCGPQTALAEISPDARFALARLSAVGDALRAAGGLVIAVLHGSRSRPCRHSILPVPGGAGWSTLSPFDSADLVVTAPGWDATFSSTLDLDLRSASISKVLLGGLASELTVDSTVRTLNDRGYECLVLTDGCAPVDADLGAHAHHSLTMSGGIFGALGTTDAVRDSLRPDR